MTITLPGSFEFLVHVEIFRVSHGWTALFTWLAPPVLGSATTSLGTDSSVDGEIKPHFSVPLV